MARYRLCPQKHFVAPQASLQRQAVNEDKFITGVSKDLGHFHATFYAVPETELVYHLKLPDCQLFGMTCNKVRQLVYQRGEIIFFTDSVRREEWLDKIS
jgi:hypothetical protein